MKKTIDELLQTPYMIIDILPYQVSRYSDGQYFKVENYFLKEDRLSELKQKHINLILKLNCYHNISIDDEEEINPAPEIIAKTMRERYVFIRVDDAMILSEPDDTHLSVFNANTRLLKLIKTLASSEGLYLWMPEEMQNTTIL